MAELCNASTMRSRKRSLPGSDMSIAALLVLVPMALWLGGVVVVTIMAANRGLSPLAFFLMSFFFTPIVGLILVLLIPPRPVEPLSRCPECREWIRAAARKCKHCHSALALSAASSDPAR